MQTTGDWKSAEEFVGNIDCAPGLVYWSKGKHPHAWADSQQAYLRLATVNEVRQLCEKIDYLQQRCEGLERKVDEEEIERRKFLARLEAKTQAASERSSGIDRLRDELMLELMTRTKSTLDSMEELVGRVTSHQMAQVQEQLVQTLEDAKAHTTAAVHETLGLMKEQVSKPQDQQTATAEAADRPEDPAQPERLVLPIGTRPTPPPLSRQSSLTKQPSNLSPKDSSSPTDGEGRRLSSVSAQNNRRRQVLDKSRLILSTPPTPTVRHAQTLDQFMADSDSDHDGGHRLVAKQSSKPMSRPSSRPSSASRLGSKNTTTGRISTMTLSSSQRAGSILSWDSNTISNAAESVANLAMVSAP